MEKLVGWEGNKPHYWKDCDPIKLDLFLDESRNIFWADVTSKGVYYERIDVRPGRLIHWYQFLHICEDGTWHGASYPSRIIDENIQSVQDLAIYLERYAEKFNFEEQVKDYKDKEKGFFG